MEKKVSDRTRRVQERVRVPFAGGWFEYLGPDCVFEVKHKQMRRVFDARVIEVVRDWVEKRRKDG